MLSHSSPDLVTLHPHFFWGFYRKNRDLRRVFKLFCAKCVAFALICAGKMKSFVYLLAARQHSVRKTNIFSYIFYHNNHNDVIQNGVHVATFFGEIGEQGAWATTNTQDCKNYWH